MPVNAKEEVDVEGGPQVQVPTDSGKKGSDPEPAAGTTQTNGDQTEGKPTKPANFINMREDDEEVAPFPTPTDDGEGLGLKKPEGETIPAGGETEPAPTQQQDDYVRRMLAEKFGMGEDIGRLDSDEAALEYLVNAYGMALDYGPAIQEYTQNRDSYLQWQKAQGQGQAQQPTPTQEPAKPHQEPDGTPTPAYWQPPEVPEDWNSLVKWDEESKTFAPKLGVDPRIASQVNKRASWLTDQYQKFWEVGPHEYLRPSTEKYAREVAREEIQTVMKEMGQRTQIDSFIDQNKDWIFKVDPQGNPMFDRATQTPLYTDKGRMFRDTLHYVQQCGVQDPAAQNQLAMQLLAGQMASIDAQGGGNANAKRDEKNKEILSRAGKNTDAGGTVRRAPPGQPNDAGLDLRRRLRGAFRAAGLNDSDLS